VERCVLTNCLVPHFEIRTLPHTQVVIGTSFGDIDVELWCKECPKACRNFIQLAMEQVCVARRLASLLHSRTLFRAVL